MGIGSDCKGELARILPTRLSKPPFLLWDCLLEVVNQIIILIKRLGAVFGQKQLKDRFRASLSARVRAPGESLEV